MTGVCNKKVTEVEQDNGNSESSITMDNETNKTNKYKMKNWTDSMMKTMYRSKKNTQKMHIRINELNMGEQMKLGKDKMSVEQRKCPMVPNVLKREM